MKRSVLKANKKQANALWDQLSKSVNAKGVQIFRRVEIDRGFEIVAPYKENGEWVRTEDNKLARKMIFRFLENPNMIEWDENAITV